uniref:Secreted protein n=1 Tax=Heterorhabditis bacteriophora TaxID=37862 RepID=A0A1I7WNS0_HETBA
MTSSSRLSILRSCRLFVISCFSRPAVLAMERLGRVWTRLSVRRPTLGPVNTVDEDEGPPDTKNEVFQMFSKSGAPIHRKSDADTLSRRRMQSNGTSARLKSLSPQRTMKVTEPSSISPLKEPTSKTDKEVKSPTTEDILDAGATSSVIGVPPNFVSSWSVLENVACFATNGSDSILCDILIIVNGYFGYSLKF